MVRARRASRTTDRFTCRRFSPLARLRTMSNASHASRDALLFAGGLVSVVRHHVRPCAAEERARRLGGEGVVFDLGCGLASHGGARIILPDQTEYLIRSVDDIRAYLNIVRRRLGLTYWSLSAWAKLKVKNAVNYIGRFEELLSAEAKRHEVQGVICGHIHFSCTDMLPKLIQSSRAQNFQRWPFTNRNLDI